MDPTPVSVSNMFRSSGSDLGGTLFKRSTQIGASAPTALASSLAFLLIAFLAFTSACMEKALYEYLNWHETQVMLVLSVTRISFHPQPACSDLVATVPPHSRVRVCEC